MVDEIGLLLLSVREKIMTHLEMLSKVFDGCFGAGKLKILEKWIMNPYSYSLDNISDD